jgi:hypothetical protein
MVCLPFNIDAVIVKIAKAVNGFCLTMNPGTAGAAYGFAEWVPAGSGRIPSCLMVILLPQIARRCHREGDYVMLSIFFQQDIMRRNWLGKTW